MMVKMFATANRYTSFGLHPNKLKNLPSLVMRPLIGMFVSIYVQTVWGQDKFANMCTDWWRILLKYVDVYQLGM